jgi:hypothetical protein
METEPIYKVDDLIVLRVIAALYKDNSHKGFEYKIKKAYQKFSLIIFSLTSKQPKL